jgi:hypothetical protein
MRADKTTLPNELQNLDAPRIQIEVCHVSLEHLNELIHQDREKFRQYVIDGINSKKLGRIDAEYFASLRAFVAQKRSQIPMKNAALP